LSGQLQRQRAGAIAKTAVVGGVVDLGLSVLKVGVGVLWHSQALVADGIHSLSDLLSDVLVLYAGHQAAQDPDLEHPYGHGRYEPLAALALGILLLIIAVGIGWDAGKRLFAPDQLLRPQPPVLAVILVSIMAKEWLCRWTLGYARRVRSDMLRANAWHHRSDAVSSAVVLVGVGGTLISLPYLDAVAAIVITVMIAHIAGKLGYQSIRELVDTGLEAEHLAAIEKTIGSVCDVRGIHMLRTRKHGCQASMDVHVLVDPRVSVSEGHMIALLVEERLKSQIDEITDVTVHIDPEDDEREPISTALLTRAEALARLGQLWKGVPEVAECRRTVLHYLNGRIDAEVYFPLSVCAGAGSRAEDIRDRLQSALAADPVFNQVFVYFAVETQ